MRSSKLFYALIAAIVLIHAAAASAATIDMDDPRRLVGRENDVRVDARVGQDTVSPGNAIGVVYQVQNLSPAPIAIADKVTVASYDPETRTITVSIGAEVPDEGKMPHLVLIAPGEKKIFRTGATPQFSAVVRSSGASPRLLEVKVSFLRDVTPFEALVNHTGTMLTDAQFDQWFESNDTIYLNTVPVRFSPRGDGADYGADQRTASRSASW
ncbi:MAG: hypothetical protein M3Q69_08105 [Acidobacteriota bacterium]|nr:hypothetical protein [Acidobacteriota bacterium]